VSGDDVISSDVTPAPRSSTPESRKNSFSIISYNDSTFYSPGDAVDDDGDAKSCLFPGGNMDIVDKDLSTLRRYKDIASAAMMRYAQEILYLDCDQSNYSSRVVFPSYILILNVFKPEIAPFDPPTPETTS